MCGMCVLCFVCCGVVMCGVGAGVGVLCVVRCVRGVCVVVCCVCGVLCVVCGAAWHAEKPRVWVQNVSVCRFKTHPCVPAKRAHVEHMRPFCRHTWMRFEPTHGDVLNLHTVKRERGGCAWGGRGGGRVLFSLFLSSLLSFSSVVLFLSSLSLLSSRSCRLFLLSQQQ